MVAIGIVSLFDVDEKRTLLDGYRSVEEDVIFGP